jgi:hypothetical protein
MNVLRKLNRCYIRKVGYTFYDSDAEVNMRTEMRR